MHSHTDTSHALMHAFRLAREELGAAFLRAPAQRVRALPSFFSKSGRARLLLSFVRVGSSEFGRQLDQISQNQILKGLPFRISFMALEDQSPDQVGC